MVVRRLVGVLGGLVGLLALGLGPLRVDASASPPDINFSATSDGAGECLYDSGMGWMPSSSVMTGQSNAEWDGPDVTRYWSAMDITGACVGGHEVRVYIQSYSPLADAMSDVTIDGQTVFRNIEEDTTHTVERDGFRLRFTYYDGLPFSTNVFSLRIQPPQTEPASLRYGFGADQRCLDVKHGHFKVGATVWLYDCNGTVAQQFTKERGWGVTSRIRSHKSSLCLWRPDRRDDGDVQLRGCDSSENELYNLRETASGKLFIAHDSSWDRYTCLSGLGKPAGEDRHRLFVSTNCHFESADDWTVVDRPLQVRQKCDSAASTVVSAGRRACLRGLQAQTRRNGSWLLSWKAMGPGWKYRARAGKSAEWTGWHSRPMVPVPSASQRHVTVEAGRGETTHSWRLSLKR